jgi:hypothetical protein
MEKKGREFKSLVNLTSYERNKYQGGTDTIKAFNKNPNPSSIALMNAVIARNDLVEFGLISPASKTITKLDKTIQELIGDDEFLKKLDDRDITNLTRFQSEYNAIVEKMPKKTYYVKKKDVPMGYYEPSEVDPEEAIDRAVEEKEELDDVNEVLTEAESVESTAPTAPASPAMSVASVFTANRMDATTFKPPSESKASDVEDENPMPMAMNSNLITTSLDSLRAMSVNEYKTFFDDFGVADLKLARDFVERTKFEDKEQQKELLRELTATIEAENGMRETLFNANDLQTSLGDNVPQEIRLTEDGNALSAFERNRNSMNLNNIELDAIDNFFNSSDEDPRQANDIGYGVSQFGNDVFRNIYGRGMEVMNPIKPAGTIADNIRNKYEVGEDWFGRDGKREKGFISESAPDMSNRFERMNMITLNKDYQGLGKFNPYVNANSDLMLGHYRDNIGAPRWSDNEGERIRQEKRAELQQQQQQQAGSARQMEGAQLGMPTGVAPPSIGQLRGQEIDYKTPNSKLRDDAIKLLRLSNKTGLELNNEFAP